MWKRNIQIFLMIALLSTLCSCATTSKHSYAVHGFQLHSHGVAPTPLEQIAILLVKHPLRVTAVDDQKLSTEYLNRAGRLYDILELPPGEHVLKVSYKSSSVKMTQKFVAGMIHFVDYNTSDEEIAKFTHRRKFKVRYYGGTLGPQRVKSIDGSRSIYIAKDNAPQDNYYYVVHGPEGKRRYDIFSIPNNSPVFSKNGKHVAFRHREGNNWFLVKDGNQSQAYNLVRSPTFSPDGKRIAYFAKQNKQHFVVLDGQPGPQYTAVANLVFSPDSTRIAYKAMKESLWHAVIDGIAGRPFKRIYQLIFSPDSQRIAYLAILSDRKEALVVDSKIGSRFDQVDHVKFSSDSRRLAYRGITDDPHDRTTDHVRVVVDGEEGPVYPITYKAEYLKVLNVPLKTYSRLSIPFFSPNGERVAYSIMRKSMRYKSGGNKPEPYFQYTFVVDGKEGEWYDDINLFPSFSEDGRRFGFTAAIQDRQCVRDMDQRLSMTLVSRSRCNRWNVSIDDNMETPTHFRATRPIFSPDGNSVAYAVMPYEGFPGWLPVVNGRIVERVSLNLRKFKFGPDSRTLHYQSFMGRKSWKPVTHRLADITKHYPVKKSEFAVADAFRIRFSPDLGAQFTDSPIPVDKALLYFYRPSKFVGSAGQFSCIINHSNCFTSVPLVNGGYFKLETSPGEVEILFGTAQSMQVQAGRAYFFKYEPSAKGRPGVSPVAQAIGAKEIRDCRLAQNE